MWNRLNNKFKDIFRAKKEEPTPEEVIRIAAEEMERAARKHEPVLAELSRNRAQIEGKVAVLAQEATGAERKAEAAVRSGRDAEAQRYLQQKASFEKQWAEYYGILEKLRISEVNARTQLDKLRLKADEMRTKGAVLAAKMQAARSQTDLNRMLDEIGAGDNLNDYEEEVQRMELESQLINELETEGFLSAFQEPEAPIDFGTYRQELAQKEEEKRQEAEAVKLARLRELTARLGGGKTAVKPESQSEKDRKSKILAEFAAVKTEKPAEKKPAEEKKDDKSDLMARFFADKKEEKPADDKSDAINKFFNP